MSQLKTEFKTHSFRRLFSPLTSAIFKRKKQVTIFINLDSKTIEVLKYHFSQKQIPKKGHQARFCSGTSLHMITGFKEKQKFCWPKSLQTVDMTSSRSRKFMDLFRRKNLRSRKLTRYIIWWNCYLQLFRFYIRSFSSSVQLSHNSP